MSERKVLNKYYAPDFDDRFKNRPKRLREKKPKPEDRQFHVRIMAPFNMRCSTCGEYVAKAKKFNSRQETVKGETFLGLRVFRFYIRCPRCMGEIVFKTDLKNEDYVLEQGATRNFQAQRFAEMQAAEEEKKREQEEADNPMLALEKRTRDSLNEMDRLDALEDLRDMSKRQSTLDPTELLKINQMNSGMALKHAQTEETEDEEFVRSIYGRTADGKIVKRITDIRLPQVPNSEPASSSDDSDDDLDLESRCKKLFASRRTARAAVGSAIAGSKSDSATASSSQNSIQTDDDFVRPYPVSLSETSKTKSLKSAIRVVKKPQSASRLPDPDILLGRTMVSVEGMLYPKVAASIDFHFGTNDVAEIPTNKGAESVYNKNDSLKSPTTATAGLVNYDCDDDDSD